MSVSKWAIIMVLATPLGASAAGHQSAQQQPAQSSDQAQNQKRDRKPVDPLAEAARRAREERKQQPKATRVWDNDNIPNNPGSISVVGESGSVSEASAVPPGEKPAGAENAETAEPAKAGESSQQTSSDSDRKAELTKQLDQAKEHLKSVSTDLDILSRRYSLDQQTYYGKPDYSSDTDGAAKLKTEENDIASRKRDVDEAQKKVDDLTEKLKELEQESAKPASNPQ